MLTARTEITDRMLIFGERHLRTILAQYEGHYNGRRPHRGCQLRPPRPDHPVADLSHQRIKRRPVLGGLINEYERAAYKSGSGPVPNSKNPRVSRLADQVPAAPTAPAVTVANAAATAQRSDVACGIHDHEANLEQPQAPAEHHDRRGHRRQPPHPPHRLTPPALANALTSMIEASHRKRLGRVAWGDLVEACGGLWRTRSPKFLPIRRQLPSAA